ncbi:uncharacterized protein MONOS_13945 [Monocercomonoides exilis]|uniref:uncharacterized protein n=1 Tax=Monocercomonoides exilis TaxID=2049356 RepID=UPI0035594C1A|nr:hypothetical protein MONOS_13945 [Monocercomonoides exilis]|eukprot:MONOS_13945.1-p1 / transcript=MONOS_13945.1 / gene=MONOS_13945 / organism=Monocercomonoides_exilis_PA203 / gene_product=unspecified product / transcript_product=unspecified product / location=Mono_scaffold00908:12649-13836(-) / protein_length=319 / sequence_SO=supercontig / SO=protein_coding / is_pseudo=false
MEERVRSGTPPSSTDSNDDSEGTEGESTCSITPVELEWAELGCVIGEDTSSDIRMEESENSSENGAYNDKHMCMSLSRQVESNIDQSTREKGESWWRRALEERAFPVSLAEECRSGIAQSTWDGYLFGFAHFGEQWENSDMDIIPEDIHEWAARSVSYFTSLVFNTNLWDIPKIKILFRGFTELERVDMERSRFEHEGIFLDTRQKTSLNGTEIAVPFLNENPTICPSSAIQVLWEEIQKRRPDGKKLFLNTETFHPFSVEGIRRLAKETLKKAGIPSHFTPYSIKAATLSTQTMSRILPTQIAKFTRLSPRTDNLAK